ncbi:MAG: phosphoribosylformylglycinamidine synthase subunit PurS [Bacteroidales bacterium]|nr:phosphoribosylformylglycinamidine synthase subunit PurS [Bacteroidales bacterium]
MKFLFYINVMPLKALLDPQGKAVTARLRTMGMKTVLDARIGKHMELSVEAKDLKAAEAIVERACKEMLHNPIMESYEFTVATEAPAKKAAAKKPAVKKSAAKPAAKKTATKKAAPAKKAAAKKTAKKK